MTDSSPKPPRVVACPTCGKPVVFAPSSRYRPFCSERCKLMDIGAWASEQYRVEGQDEPLSDDDKN
ncbi:MAG: DNA gyrase inhibitor YacG [Candidatus Dactylopiibacterium sp.]|nr:DNA gyrase inhibitor YacG [Candidatus Dactylopiibacterium sp.]